LPCDGSLEFRITHIRPSSNLPVPESWCQMGEPGRPCIPDLPEDISDVALRLVRLLGYTDQRGCLKEEGRDKLAQVLAFLPLMRNVLDRTSKRRTLYVLECACGKGHLSLLLNQILLDTACREVHWIGIDSSGRLISKCRSIAEAMGYANVEYHRSRIADYHDGRDIKVLISLHACDTATDEALVKGVELGCRYIFLVPCCQREVANQLTASNDPRLIPLIENYTHRKLLGSVLSDALRRLVLESFGYNVDIFEYISVRRTEKNIMIRATYGKTPSERSWQLYQTTLNELGLDIALQRLLAEKGMAPAVNRASRGAASSPL